MNQSRKREREKNERKRPTKRGEDLILISELSSACHLYKSAIKCKNLAKILTQFYRVQINAEIHFQKWTFVPPLFLTKKKENPRIVKSLLIPKDFFGPGQFSLYRRGRKPLEHVKGANAFGKLFDGPYKSRKLNDISSGGARRARLFPAQLATEAL